MADQLSMLDTMFLELEQLDESAHMHIGAALIFDPLPGGGTPDIAEMRDHMRARVGALPRFAQQLSGTHAGPLSWLTWEPADAFDLDAHVHHATLPAPGGEAELNEWLGEFWSHRLDRHRPLWEMTLLDGLEGGRWALATKTHHCLVDGVGSLDIGHLLLDASPDAPPLPPQPLPPPTRRTASTAHGRFWLSPGLVLRGARAGIGAARPSARVLRPRASGRRARRARRGDRGAADEPQRADERHPAVRDRAPGPRRRQGGEVALGRHGQRRRARDLRGRAATPAARSRRGAARGPAGAGAGEHPERRTASTRSATS